MEEANAIWGILAGHGLWGAIVTAVMTVIWAFAKPHLDDWAKRCRLDKLFMAVETGVVGCKALYTDEMKKANGDGKLTKDEVNYIREQCRDYIVQFMAQQGVDALKEYGPHIIDMLCEWMLSRVKSNAVASVAKAVVPPLPDLQP